MKFPAKVQLFFYIRKRARKKIAEKGKKTQNCQKICVFHFFFVSLQPNLRIMAKRLLYILPLAGLLLTACGRPDAPKPYGYYRIATPPHTYRLFDDPEYPYSFLYSRAAVIRPVAYQDEAYWINIVYPTLNAAIHCSYKPVQGNLRQLTDDAWEFVFNHAVKASAIPEHAYANPEARTYGVLCELQGNTASPLQFYLTDSTSHFFRGAVYFNCVPNQDSLAPLIEYMHEDVLNLIETLRW